LEIILILNNLYVLRQAFPEFGSYEEMRAVTKQGALIVVLFEQSDEVGISQAVS